MASIINAATSGGLISTADTSGILQLQTAGTTAVTVDASQAVGIGTATPNTAGYGGGVLGIFGGTSTGGNIWLTSDTTTAGNRTGRIGFGTEGNSANKETARVWSLAAGSTAGNLGGDLLFSTKADGGSLTERARFNSTGAFVFNGGTTTADGIGITFPATQSASTNANTLDDYEEGTFNAGIAFGGNAVSVTYLSQAGAYVKIGRMVWCSFCIQTSSKGSSTGNLTLTGLPFTSSAVNSYFAVASEGLFNMTGSSGGAGTANVGFYSEMGGSATTVTCFFKTAAANAWTNITNTDVTNTMNYFLTICYQTST